MLKLKWRPKSKSAIIFFLGNQKLQITRVASRRGANNTLLYHVDDLYVQFLADQKQAWIEDKIIELLED